MTQPETPILKRCLLALSRAGSRVFRCNTGQGWTGTVTSRDLKSLTLFNPRPFHAGLIEGGADIIGWTTITVTPDMVGARVAVFTAVEVKTLGGRVSPAQRTFLDAVTAAGGIAGVARTDDQAVEIVRRFSPRGPST
jgi:hypothetical protein